MGTSIYKGLCEVIGVRVLRQSVLYKLYFFLSWLIKLGFQMPRQKPLMCTFYFNNIFLFLCPRRLDPVFRVVHSEDGEKESVWLCVVSLQANTCLIWGCTWNEGTSYTATSLQIA